VSVHPVYCAISLITGALLAVFVLYVRRDLALGGLGYGTLMAFFSLGNLLLAWLAPLLRARWGSSGCSSGRSWPSPPRSC
jgi:hypothetical protein